MPDPITQTDLENAKVDAQTIDDVANGPADLNGTGLATSRTGGDKRTLAKLEADFQTVIDSQTVQEETAAAAAALAASTVEGIAASFYGSVMFPYENEELPNPDHCLMFNVADTDSFTTDDANAFFNQAGNSIAVFWDCPVETYKSLNRAPMLIGTSSNAVNRAFSLRYQSENFSGNPSTGRFEFEMTGKNTDSSVWQAYSAAIPDTATRLVPHVFQDGTNLQVDVLDIDTGTWYRGTPVAKPAGFVGLTIITNEIGIGSCLDGALAADYPPDNTGSPQSGLGVRGSMADVLFTDVELTDANIEAIYIDGDTVSSTVSGGLANVRLHAPLVTAAGTITLDVTSNIAAVQTAGLDMLGDGALPGPTFKAQGATSFVLPSISNPGLIALESGAQFAEYEFDAEVANLTASDGREVQYRFVTSEGSGTDWLTGEHTLVGTTATIRIQVPFWLMQRFQIQFRFNSDPTVVACTHGNMQLVNHIIGLSQSEGVYSFGRLFDVTGAESGGELDGANPILEPGADTVTFVDVDGAVWATRASTGRLGGSACALINYIRRRTQRPVVIAMHMVSGTSMRALFDDSVGSRDWSAEEAAHLYCLNRGRDGTVITTGMVKFGWDASDNEIKYGRRVNFPVYKGRPYSGETYSFNLDHYIFDGTFSSTMKCVEVPCNRVTDGDEEGLNAETYNITEADQRDSQINWGHRCGYDVGPTTTTHAMENETADVLPLGSPVTHPKAKSWEGDAEMAQGFAEGILMAMGAGTYPGVVRFETIEVDPNDANSVLVTLGPPRKYPGLGLADPDTGYRLDEEPHTPEFPGVKLRTKRSTGNAKWGFEAKLNAVDSYSIQTIQSATIVGNDQVRLTFASAVVPGETAIRYQPGAPGNYDRAVVNQLDWRAGQLFFSGEYFENGKEPGFQVTGSNQELVLP